MFSGYIFALISAVCYGLGPILFKLAYAAGLSELDMMQARYAIGSLLLLGFLLLFARGRLRITRPLLLKAAGLGLGIYAIETWMFISALRYIPASTNSLIFYFYPVVVTLIAIPLLKQKPGRRTILALVLVTLGGVLVSWDAFSRDMNLTGILYSLGATFTFSFYLIGVQQAVKKEEPLSLTLCVFLCMGLAFLFLKNPLTLLQCSTHQWTLLLLVGLVPTALAVPMLYLAIERIGSSLASIVSSFELVATLGAASLFLQEEINWPQIVGTLLILTGVILPNLRLQHLRRLTTQGPKTS